MSSAASSTTSATSACAGGSPPTWPRAEQSHRVGPAVFGKVKLEGRQSIRYNAAWLVGSNAAAHRTFRLQTEYEF
jgi:hypothetical protein